MQSKGTLASVIKVRVILNLELVQGWIAMLLFNIHKINGMIARMLILCTTNPFGKPFFSTPIKVGLIGDETMLEKSGSPSNRPTSGYRGRELIVSARQWMRLHLTLHPYRRLSPSLNLRTIPRPIWSVKFVPNWPSTLSLKRL